MGFFPKCEKIAPSTTTRLLYQDQRNIKGFACINVIWKPEGRPVHGLGLLQPVKRGGSKLKLLFSATYTLQEQAPDSLHRALYTLVRAFRAEPPGIYALSPSTCND
jgi:hypothetical protein